MFFTLYDIELKLCKLVSNFFFWGALPNFAFLFQLALMRREDNYAYSVELPNLKDGVNHFVFEIDKKFFAGFEQPLVQEGKIRIETIIRKNLNQLEVLFDIEGNIELNCDRCDYPFQYSVKAERQIIYAYAGSGIQEDDFEELVFIDPKKHLLDLSQEMYDFICLEIPIRKVPEQCDDTCPRNPLLNSDLGIVTEESEEESSLDPRWAALRKWNNESEN